MLQNVGSLDRVVRIVAGLALVGFGLYDTSNLRWIGIAGVVLVATAIFRFCPAYWILRIRTLALPRTAQK